MSLTSGLVAGVCAAIVSQPGGMHGLALSSVFLFFSLGVMHPWLVERELTDGTFIGGAHLLVGILFLLIRARALVHVFATGAVNFRLLRGSLNERVIDSVLLSHLQRCHWQPPH